MRVRFIDASFALFYVIFYSLPANYVYLIDISFSLSSVFLNKSTCFGLFFQKMAFFRIKKSWHAFCYIISLILFIYTSSGILSIPFTSNSLSGVTISKPLFLSSGNIVSSAFQVFGITCIHAIAPSQADFSVSAAIVSAEDSGLESAPQYIPWPSNTRFKLFDTSSTVSL